MNPGTEGEEAFALPVGVVTLGRTADNEIFCIHKSLSRRHAQIECDGAVLRVRDLGSKNGIFFDGERVESCELVVGDAFRCGDVPFLVRRTAEPAPHPPLAHTLPSPLALPNLAAGPTKVSRTVRSTSHAAGAGESSPRHESKLFALLRASELLASGIPVDRLLDEIVALGAQAVEADVAVLLLRGTDGAPRPHRAWPSPIPARPPYDRRVVAWVLDRGSASFADVPNDELLGRAPPDDEGIRVAMGAPIDTAHARIGMLYADRRSSAEGFRADDVAFFRVLANLTAVGLR